MPTPTTRAHLRAVRRTEFLNHLRLDRGVDLAARRASATSTSRWRTPCATDSWTDWLTTSVGHAGPAPGQDRHLPLGGVPDGPPAGQCPAGHRPDRRGPGGPERPGSGPRRDRRRRRSSPAWATVAWVGWPPASPTRWPRWAGPRSATASSTSTASSSSPSRTAARSSVPTSGSITTTRGSSSSASTRSRSASAATSRWIPATRARTWHPGGEGPGRAAQPARPRLRQRRGQHAAAVEGARLLAVQPRGLQRR